MEYRPTELEEELEEELKEEPKEAPGTLMPFYKMRVVCDPLHLIPVYMYDVPPCLNTTYITKALHETSPRYIYKYA